MPSILGQPGVHQTEPPLHSPAQHPEIPIPPALTAIKHDIAKEPISLIPLEAIYAEARVMAHGAQKYARFNWRGGFAYSRLIDAALRHIFAYANGETLDPESGESHLAHARCCLAFLIVHDAEGLGVDDRVRPRVGTADSDRGIPGG